MVALKLAAKLLVLLAVADLAFFILEAECFGAETDLDGTSVRYAPVRNTKNTCVNSLQPGKKHSSI